LGPWLLALTGDEEPPRRGLQPQTREEIPGDGAEDKLGGLATGIQPAQTHLEAEQGRESIGLLAIFPQCLNRKAVAEAGLVAGSLRRQDDDLVRVRDRQGPEVAVDQG